MWIKRVNRITWTDQEELACLAELLGPLGLEFLDEKLLKTAMSHVCAIKVFARNESEF